MKNSLCFSVLVAATSILTIPGAHASKSMFETETAAPVGSGQVAIPVVILRHADGSREVLPIENADSSAEASAATEKAVQYPFDLGRVGGYPISLSFVGGVEAGTLEGAAASLGVFIGAQDDGMLGHVRSGILIEVDPGTEGTKVGLGWTIGSAQLVGLNLNATYIKSYGRLSPVPAGQDLMGIELGGEFTLGHWFVGVLESLQTGEVYVNAGAGVRFY